MERFGILTIILVFIFITATALFTVLTNIPAYYTEWQITSMIGVFLLLVGVVIIAFLKTGRR